MSELRDLLNKAKASSAKAQTSAVKSKTIEKPSIHRTQVKEDIFDTLDDFTSDLAVNSVPPNFNTGISKDGEQLEVGDPVVGIHQAQNMSGQVIAVQGDDITVEWKDRTTSTVRANTLELSNVDDDMIEETMYIEAIEPNLGFDKESFMEDTDLESLLKGDSEGSTQFRYNLNGDI